MLKISEMRDVSFDGKHYPYVPPEALRIAEALKLHRDWSEDVGPGDLRGHPPQPLAS